MWEDKSKVFFFFKKKMFHLLNFSIFFFLNRKRKKKWSQFLCVCVECVEFPENFQLDNSVPQPLSSHITHIEQHSVCTKEREPSSSCDPWSISTWFKYPTHSVYTLPRRSLLYIYPPLRFFFFLSVMPFSFLGVSVVHNFFFFPLALYVHKGLARENKGQQTCIILMYYMY